jgi:hypothetical protein
MKLLWIVARGQWLGKGCQRSAGSIQLRQKTFTLAPAYMEREGRNRTDETDVTERVKTEKWKVKAKRLSG